ESKHKFNKLIADYIDRFHPVTPDEFDLIETMAVNRWRLQRAWSLETAGLIHEQRAQAESTQGQNPQTRYALAHRSLANPPRSLESLSRYETRCDRQYHRAAKRLAEIIAVRERCAAEDEKEKLQIRTHLPEQNQSLPENHPSHRTGGRTIPEPGGEPGDEPGGEPSPNPPEERV